LRNPANKQTD